MSRSHVSSLQASALSAVLAVVALAGLLYVWTDVPFALEDVMSGSVIVPLADHTKMIERLGRVYFVDSVFIVGWIGAWVGLGLLLEGTSRVIAATATVLGVLGAVLDFAENEISRSLIAAAMEGTLYPQWLIAHDIVLQLSYLLPFSGAFVASLGLVGLRSVASSVVALVGTFGVMIAMLGVCMPALGLAPSIWFGVWFAGLAWVLWTNPATEKRAP